MIAIICGLAFMIGFLFYDHTVYRSIDFGDVLISILMGILGCLFGLIPLLIGNQVFITDDMGLVNHEQVELIALKDNYQIESTTFLFTSIADSELKYTYLYEVPEKGVTAKSVSADKAYIKYIDESQTPYVQKWETRSKSMLINWLFCPGEYGYTFYLPQGSVVENVYEVDLE